MKDNAPILLVEDYEIDQEAVERAFAKIGIQNPLIKKSNGEEGLAYLKDENSERPVLILLDINMPRMNGIEFLKIVKSEDRFKRIPVVVFTTSKEEKDKVESFNLGVAGYIVKPPNSEQFTEVLQKIELYWSINEIPEA